MSQSVPRGRQRARFQAICSVALMAIGATALPGAAFAQAAQSEPEVVRIRQVLCDEFSAAVARGDTRELAIHYAKDVVLVTTVPDLVGPFVGREAAMPNLESLPKRVERYKSVAQQGGMRADGTAWTVGIATFWVKGADGIPVRRWMRWADTIRKNGDRWEVVWQVNATLPARPNPDPTGD